MKHVVYFILTFLFFVETNSQSIIKCYRAQVESGDVFQIEYTREMSFIPNSLNVRISQTHYSNGQAFERIIKFEADLTDIPCSTSRLIIPVTMQGVEDETMIKIDVKSLGLDSELDSFEAIILNGIETTDAILDGVIGYAKLAVTFTSTDKSYNKNWCKLDKCPNSIQKLDQNKVLCMSFIKNGHRHTLKIIGGILQRIAVFRHYEIQIKARTRSREGLVEKISYYAEALPCNSDETQSPVKINVDPDADKLTIKFTDEIERKPLKAIFTRRSGEFVRNNDVSDIKIENIDIKSTSADIAITQSDAINVYATRTVFDNCGDKHSRVIITQYKKGEVVIATKAVYQDSSAIDSKVVKIGKASDEKIQQCLRSRQ